MWKKGITITLLSLLTACQYNPYGSWKREGTAPVDPAIRVSAAVSRLQSDYGECLLYLRAVGTAPQYQTGYSSTPSSSASLSTDQQQQIMDNCMRSKGWVRAMGPVEHPNGEKFSLDPFRNMAPQPQPIMMNPMPQLMAPYPVAPAPVVLMPAPAPVPQALPPQPTHSEPGFTYYGRATASAPVTPRPVRPAPAEEEPIYIK